MTKADWKDFELKLKIKDHDGQVKELKDKKPIELKGDNGKLHGEQYIKFKKDAKEYNVLVKVEKVERGFIKYKLKSAKFEIPSNADFSYYHEKNGSSWDCKLVQPLRVGRVVTLSLLAVFTMGGIIAFILWKKKKG